MSAADIVAYHRTLRDEGICAAAAVARVDALNGNRNCCKRERSASRENGELNELKAKEMRGGKC